MSHRRQAEFSDTRLWPLFAPVRHHPRTRPRVNPGAEVAALDEPGGLLHHSRFGVDERQIRKDLDLLWYLWSGERSPLFGKDRIATLERDFIADKKPHHEERDPYFKLIHEAPFCEKVLAEFGVDPQRGLIVNGHVPVKIEKGESPLKRSGKAITIDGAFSEAYGDHGYTLILAPDGIKLAEHYHFESVKQVIETGADIIPKMTAIQTYAKPHTVDDTEEGLGVRRQQPDQSRADRLRNRGRRRSGDRRRPADSKLRRAEPGRNGIRHRTFADRGHLGSGREPRRGA